MNYVIRVELVVFAVFGWFLLNEVGIALGWTHLMMKRLKNLMSVRWNPKKINVSSELCEEVIKWEVEYQTALNGEYSLDSSPWSDEHFKGFFARLRIISSQAMISKKVQVCFVKKYLFCTLDLTTKICL